MNELQYKIIATALLVGQEQRERIFGEVQPSYFPDKPLGAIFGKLLTTYRSFPKADSSAFFSALTDDEKRDVLVAIDNMISPSIAAEQLDDTLSAFREDYARRTLKSRVTELAIGDPTAADIRSLAETAESLSKKTRSSAEKYIAEFDDIVEVIPTGFKELDTLLNGGFMKGTLTTVGARPSTGKTTFAINIATRDPGKKVLFISVEMSARMIYDRIVSDKADEDYSHVGRHLIPRSVAADVVGKYGSLTVADDVNEIGEIETLIFRERPDLAVIDYIQIVTANRRFPDNRQRIDYISQRLKAAAKRTGCCIVSLSQITRGGKDRPTMSDLKESGGLEQDSDYIILLYREYVNCKEAQISPKAATVTLDKNKFGRTGEIEMDFDGARQRFTETKGVIVRPAKAEVEEDDDLPF